MKKKTTKKPSTTTTVNKQVDRVSQVERLIQGLSVNNLVSNFTFTDGSFSVSVQFTPPKPQVARRVQSVEDITPDKEVFKELNLSNTEEYLDDLYLTDPVEYDRRQQEALRNSPTDGR